MGSVADKAAAAADALRDRVGRMPAVPPAAFKAVLTPETMSPDLVLPERLSPSVADRPALRPAHTDWLQHRLAIRGPAADRLAFEEGAAGAGIIPWHYDLDRMEADYFHLLMGAPPAERLSVAAARTFARQLRRAVGNRHDLALAQVGASQACPLDLHALVPVPASVLALGPDQPDAQAWLWEHWGTIEPLRHVTRETDEEELRLAFWSVDWTPWRALATVAARWPSLRFDVRPIYGT